MSEETGIGGPQGRFQTTLWSVVRDSQEGQGPALEQLFSLYWKPVYFFIRRRGHDVEAAKDLTQGFFARVLEKEYLQDYDFERGRFRSFLRAALSHYLSDERDRVGAKKRGGDLDFVTAERDLEGAEAAADRAFDRQWAVDVLQRAMKRLEALVPPADLSLLFGEGEASIGVEERKYRARRVRQRLRELVCEELLPTLEGPAQLDAEIRDLFRSLG